MRLSQIPPRVYVVAADQSSLVSFFRTVEEGEIGVVGAFIFICTLAPTGYAYHQQQAKQTAPRPPYRLEALKEHSACCHRIDRYPPPIGTVPYSSNTAHTLERWKLKAASFPRCVAVALAG